MNLILDGPLVPIFLYENETRVSVTYISLFVNGLNENAGKESDFALVIFVICYDNAGFFISSLPRQVLRASVK